MRGTRPGTASEWPPGTACKNISHCKRLWNAIRQSTRGWQPKDYKVYLPRASRNVPGKSANPVMFGWEFWARCSSVKPYLLSVPCAYGEDDFGLKGGALPSRAPQS